MAATVTGRGRNKWHRYADRVVSDPRMPDATRKAIIRLLSVLYACDGLIQKLCQLPKGSVNHDRLIHAIASHYFAHCVHLAAAVAETSAEGWGCAAGVLSRSIIESTIDLSYLWLCKKISGSDEQRVAWAEYSDVRRGQFDRLWQELQSWRQSSGMALAEPRRLFTDTESERLDRAKNDFEMRYRRRHWAVYDKPYDRAKKVDEQKRLMELTGLSLSDTYVLGYRWASELVHGESASAANYMRDEPEGVKTVFGPDFGLTCQIAVGLTAQCCRSVGMLMAHIVRVQYHFDHVMHEFASEHL